MSSLGELASSPTPFQPTQEVTAIVSTRDRLAALLERWSGRPTLFAVAVMNVITGLGLGAGIAAADLGGGAGPTPAAFSTPPGRRWSPGRSRGFPRRRRWSP